LTSRDDAAFKIKRFREANIKVLDHIGYIGQEMKLLLKWHQENKIVDV